MPNDAIHVLARGVFLDGDKLLLTQRLKGDPPYLYLPGGHVDAGETAAEALRRELWEETGHPVFAKRFLGCLECLFRPRADICHGHEYNLVFLAAFAHTAPPRAFPSREPGLAYLWVPMAELGTLDFRPSRLGLCLPGWLAGDSASAFVTQREVGHG